jgi:diguanylate cyclase (GGDEF)-like protein/PAS domain S-box-containing protein
MTAPLPADEEERLQILSRDDTPDTEPEKAFDNITRLAAQICRTPLAVLTLSGRERQWFEAEAGVEITDIPHALSFCTLAAREPGLIQIPDLTLDTCFQDSPLVTGGVPFRFYAGVPLVTRGGHVLGTLSIFDHSPRTLSDKQRTGLEDLSRIAMTQLDLYRTVTEQAHAAGILREQERQIQAITDTVPLLIARISPDYRYRFANRTYQDMFRVPHYQVIGHTMCEVLGESVFAAVRPYADRALAGERVSFILRGDYRTVGLRYTDATYVPEFGPEGGIIGFLVSVMDITEHKHTEAALRERTEVLENVLATIPHQVFWKDRDSIYLGCNSNFAQAVGLGVPTDIIGRSDLDLPWTAAEAQAHRRDDRVVMATGAASLDQEEDYRHADGTVTPGLASKLPLRDAEGRIVGVLGISQDINERKVLEAERERLLEEMEHLLASAVDQADRDPLTGLINHRTFHKRLEEEAVRAQCEGMPLAVAMLDLDNFKFFNDAYGHPAGDDVLRRVAASLSHLCRSCDTVARFGGDKFTLLMPGLGEDEAARLTRRVIAGLGQEGYVPPGHDVSVPLSLSSGVAVFPVESASRLEVLDLAAARLRLAKTGGDERVAEALNVRAAMSRKVKGFSMLDALVAAVDNKDRYTRRHSEDVLAYSIEIAKQLGLDDKAQATVAVAALLHDVGKIGVPDAILRKPGRLTEEEFQAMQQHPMMGAIIVGAVPGFEETLDAVRHHHERWDGGGYPFGLRGEETPLTARLMAVADAFSAMTTDRPYRKGMTEGKALTILRDGAGTQWDPHCVRAFLQTRCPV